MKISFSTERLIPNFLLADKNGYAIAKAIEKAFQIVAEKTEEGIGILKDPMKMPEWRLDERAEELNCLYDYNGTVEQKRYWIINAKYLYSVYGTPQAIYNFLEGFFNGIEVEEFWQYGGDPFHFRVTVNDPVYSADKIAWAQKAIMNVKNVRSVLDSVMLDSTTEIVVSADADWFDVPYLYAATDELTNANDIQDWDEIPTVAKTDISKTDEGVTG